MSIKGLLDKALRRKIWDHFEIMLCLIEYPIPDQVIHHISDIPYLSYVEYYFDVGW